jgi:dihydroflavonol-4-reductase
MKVFVTGADGFLGNNIVRELLKRDYSVRTFLQEGRDVPTLDELKIEKVYGDILDAESVDSGANGCDYIIHAAANTNIWPYRSELTRNVNIKGTQNVIEAALNHKVKRLVSIGTANSFANGTAQKPGNEQQPFVAHKFGLDYIDSKYEAQQAILKAVKSDGLDAIILNPTFMLGPYDTKPSSGALLIALYEGKVPGYTTGGRNFVYVKDVAIAACNGLAQGEAGECYIMANENLTYKAFNELVAEELNIKPPKLYVPKALILIYGAVAELLARATGKTPAVSRTVARISLETNYYTAAKAVQALNMPQTPIRQAVKEAFDWFKENGYLNKKN